MEDVGGMPLSFAIRYRFFAVLRFENWLIEHVQKGSTLGKHLKKEVIFLDAACARLVRCYHCTNIHFALGPGDLARIFYKRDARLANTVFSMYKQNQPIALPNRGSIRAQSLMAKYL